MSKTYLVLLLGALPRAMVLGLRSSVALREVQLSRRRLLGRGGLVVSVTGHFLAGFGLQGLEGNLDDLESSLGRRAGLLR